MPRKLIRGNRRQRTEILPSNTEKSAAQTGHNKPRTRYRVLETVRTARGEGIIKFVFTRRRDGKNSYSVNFSNKRLSVIFHEDELARCPGKSRHA